MLFLWSMRTLTTEWREHMAMKLFRERRMTSTEHISTPEARLHVQPRQRHRTDRASYLCLHTVPFFQKYSAS